EFISALLAINIKAKDNTLLKLNTNYKGTYCYFQK
ncbi:hypothetical protein BMETH_13511062444, partial [methanotrophic bacterial endosymbiont of Bathymodiolus sp.]